MSTKKIRFLSKKDIAKAVSMQQAIETMHPAFIQLSDKTAVAPLRTQIPMAEHRAGALFMPAYLPSINRFGIKLVAVHPANPQNNLPMIHALVVVMDAMTGAPLAVMDGEFLTALRTGAASGLATNLLSRKNSETVAIFGAGVQGRTQLEAVCAVRNIHKAYILDKDEAKRKRFSEELTAQLNIEIIPAATAEIIREADIICTATSALTPVFTDGHLKSGAHINGIGSYRPDMAEIPPETIRRAKVFVDSRAACLAEAGDIIQTIPNHSSDPDLIQAEIGEVASGKAAGRTSPDEITVFKSVGNAVQDLSVAQLALQNAQKMNLGTEIEI